MQLKYQKMAINQKINTSFVLLFGFVVSVFFHECYAFDGEVRQEDNKYHNIHIGSLLPESVCSTSTIKDNSKTTSLKVVKSHGPCSPLKTHNSETPNVYKILSADQTRVNSIQYELSKNKSGPPHITLPGRIGTSFLTVEYVVTIELGTPTRELTLVFDTGSDVTWTQCQPCKHCYNQLQPIFDPSTSSTYHTIPCNSLLCTDAYNRPLGCSRNNTCSAKAYYIDGSYTMGNLAFDILTVTPNEVIKDFAFLCSQNSQIDFGRISGILGLSRGKLSFVSQTALKYDRYFSYCLPSSPSVTGHLTFGREEQKKPLQYVYTPFVRNAIDPRLYFIEILGIKVGGQLLPISESVFKVSGTFIDSGTVTTRLPPDAYAALRTVFREEMRNYTMVTRPISIFDTCYVLNNIETVSVPRISFIFGRNVEVPLDITGTLFAINAEIYCMAFAPNRSPTQIAIFGNIQQRTLDIVYDVNGGKLGFALNGCA